MNNKKIIHISYAYSSILETNLIDEFDYCWIPIHYDFNVDIDNYDILKNEQNKKDKKTYIFLIEEGAQIWQEYHILKKIPDYQIIYKHDDNLDERVKQLLRLKGAVARELFDYDELSFFFKQEYVNKPNSFKLNMDYFSPTHLFSKSYKREGYSYFLLSGDFGNSYKQVGNWRMTNIIEDMFTLSLSPEISISHKNVEVMFKVFILDVNTSDIIEIKEIIYKKNSPLIFDCNQKQCYLNIAIYAKGGYGELQLGNIHVRNYFPSNSVFRPGGKLIKDEEHRDDEIAYYFNSGDLKPPLAVYFSGYRPLEGFEGRRMMSNMECPYILFSDPRIEGGNFYLGSKTFEKKVASVIRGKLEDLGFDSSDLILSGMSMGTFGALYYASDVEPGYVITAKPIVNLGAVSLEERINRSNSFPTSLDILYYNTGLLSTIGADELNNRFWKKFATGDYKSTTFSFGYMKQDDYDKKAFDDLYHYLKLHSPEAKINFKGFIGRHNDDNEGMVQWFLKQYRSALKNGYGRIPKI